VHGAGVLHVLPAEHLGPVHHEDLDGGESRDGNAVATPERGVEPVGHGAVNEGVVDELGGGHAGNAEHRPAAVHKLSLLVPLEGLLVLTEAEGVEAVVTGHGAVEVLGGGGAREVVGAGVSGDGHDASAGRAGRDVAASLEPRDGGLSDDSGHFACV